MKINNSIKDEDSTLSERVYRIWKEVDVLVMPGNTIPIEIFYSKPSDEIYFYYLPKDKNKPEQYGMYVDGITAYHESSLSNDASLASTITHEVRHRLQAHRRVEKFEYEKPPTTLQGLDKVFDGRIPLIFKKNHELEFDATVIEYITMLVIERFSIQANPQELARIVMLEPSTIQEYFENLSTPDTSI